MDQCVAVRAYDGQVGQLADAWRIENCQLLTVMYLEHPQTYAAQDARKVTLAYLYKIGNPAPIEVHSDT